MWTIQCCCCYLCYCCDNASAIVIPDFIRPMSIRVTYRLLQLLGEIYKIFLLKHVVRNNDLATPEGVTSLSTIDWEFLPCLLFHIVWNTSIFVMSLVSLHFSCCKSSTNVVSVFHYSSLTKSKVNVTEGLSVVALFRRSITPEYTLSPKNYN